MLTCWTKATYTDTYHRHKEFLKKYAQVLDHTVQSAGNGLLMELGACDKVQPGNNIYLFSILFVNSVQ